MILDILLFHRAKSAQPHMERHIRQLYAFLRDRVKQLPGKVQPCRGCGGAAHVPGVNGLVAFAVPEFLLDIGRQGHFPQPLQHFQKNAVIVECEDLVSVLTCAYHIGAQLPLPKAQMGARRGLAARAGQALPLSPAQIPQQHHLHAAAGGAAAEEPGGQHAGVVHHETVPLPQQLRELVEVPVFHLPAVLIETEEPGRVPALQRRLCDQLRR